MSNAAREGGQKTVAMDLKNARCALWKNPEDLTERQAATLAGIAETNAPPYRACLLREQLRQVFALKGEEGMALLDAALTHRLSNARVESVNTKLRLLTRIAFGFRSPEAHVALAMLDLGSMCPPLPGRVAA